MGIDNMRIKLIILNTCLALIHWLNAAAFVSPIDCGFKSAQSDIERYWVLYKTHEKAVSTGQEVSYKGMSDFSIEIPLGAKSIPLTPITDFRGITITVTNNNIDGFYLFSLTKDFSPLIVPQTMVDGGNFQSVKELAHGLKLLVVTDREPWVRNRAGYDYGATRKDILLLRNGVALNSTVMPYGNIGVSDPEFSYTDADNTHKLIANLHIVRSDCSTRIVRCFRVDGINNVYFTNISLTTPWNTGLYGDGAISVANCTNVYFNDIIIDGTYSRNDKYGYGIVMNNVWNSYFNNLKGDANWGLFGTWNVNVCTLKYCDINRFDIHCYGKDVFFKRCILRNNYSQFSSVYGTISYDNCNFIDYVPYLNDVSYNSYVPFNLIMRQCKMHIVKSNNEGILCRMCNNLDDVINSRPELCERFWPNVYIDGLKLTSDKQLIGAYLFYVRNPSSQNVLIGGCQNITIKRLKYKGTFKLANRKVKLKDNMRYSLNYENIKSRRKGITKELD